MANDFCDDIALAAEYEPAEYVPPAVVPGRRVHVDGDYLAYKAAGSDRTSAGTARSNALALIKDFKRRTGSESAVVHLTSKGCHKGERYLCATVKPYQGQRKDDYKPVNWEYLRIWLEAYEGDHFRKKLWSSREADDGIAASAQYAAKQGGLDGIATADKDMRMLPGIHVTWPVGWDDPVRVFEVPNDTYSLVGDGKQYGMKWFWLQMLQGDTADNIPGLEYVWEHVKKYGEERMNKCGPKTAENYLRGTKDSAEAQRIVTELYDKCYRGRGADVGADRFVEQASLLWLRRGKTADVLDFMDWIEPAPEIEAAAQRLYERVKLERAEITEMV